MIRLCAIWIFLPIDTVMNNDTGKDIQAQYKKDKLETCERSV